MRRVFVLCWMAPLLFSLPGHLTRAQTTPGKYQCALLDVKRPSLYIVLDKEWKDQKTARLIIRNNMACAVTFTTTGRHSVIKKRGTGFRVHQPASDEIEDGGLVTLQYKVNSKKQPWAFVTYWPYDHVVFTLRLLGGRAAKFIVPLEHIKGERQIAVTFNYEWETFAATSGIQHLVFSSAFLAESDRVKFNSH
jgi:hypothetical protein